MLGVLGAVLWVENVPEGRALVFVGEPEVGEGRPVLLGVAGDEDAAPVLGDVGAGVDDAVADVVAQLLFQQELDGGVGASLVVVEDVGDVS